jgi:transposase
MSNLLFVGLDVDDTAFHATIIQQNTGETWYFKCRPNSTKLIEKLLNIHSKAQDFKICYESTYLGFSLCRKLREQDFNCDVIASSLIPVLAGNKVKTDRCDSQKLAQFYMKDLLTIVHVPTQEDESERDLVRSRTLIKDQIVATKNRIQSILRKTGLDYRQETGFKLLWTLEYKKWLRKKIKELELTALKQNLILLTSSLENLSDSLKCYNVEIETLAASEKYSIKVKALTAYRGIQVLTAMKIITEIGDIKRFPHPRKLVSYLGLDIREFSSGGKEKKYGITKMGNEVVRTALVEANQKSSSRPVVSQAIRTRRESVPIELTRVADKCMNRLFIKSTALLRRDKNKNKIKVACAREMVGFIWESLHLAS